MERKIRMLMTIEEVGSKGTFFTEGAIFKTCAIIVLGVVTQLFILGQLSFFLPTIITLPVSIIPALKLVDFLIRKLVLNEKEFMRVASRDSSQVTVDSKKFSDIYRVDNNKVCFHSSGHKSIFVRITRGSTIKMRAKNVDEYFDTLAKFEDELVGQDSKFTLKCYDIEQMDMFRGAIDYQSSLISSIKNQNVNRTTISKNRYIDKFTKEFGKDYDVVYVIVSRFLNADDFRKTVDRAIIRLRHECITDVGILDKNEIDLFGETFFDVEYFDCINLGESLELDLLKVEDNVI